MRKTGGQAVAGIAAAARASSAAGGTARLTRAPAATPGAASACPAIATPRMTGTDTGVATRPGPSASYTAVWMAMKAAMMPPGPAAAVVRAARAGGARATPMSAASCPAARAVAGLVVSTAYRPHDTATAGATAIAAGGHELTPLKRHCRRRCREMAGSGFGFGLCCVGSSAGLMAMLVVLGMMSVGQMAVIAVVVTAQKLLPPRAALDVPLALAIVALGVLIIVAPSSVPGLTPPM